MPGTPLYGRGDVRLRTRFWSAPAAKVNHSNQQYLWRDHAARLRRSSPVITGGSAAACS